MPATATGAIRGSSEEPDSLKYKQIIKLRFGNKIIEEVLSKDRGEFK